jgi:F-type H+-transporting ATPase subunit a
MGHGGAGIGEHHVLVVSGLSFNLDTLYMTWLTMAILVFGSLLIRINWKLIPGSWNF